MTLLGRAAVAVWSDVTPAGRASFLSWHSREHLAERVSLPGFLRARRFVGVASDLERTAAEFFILYEVDALASLDGPAYQARLDAPTPRTIAVGPTLINTARAVCTVSASIGSVEGGLVGTWYVEAGREASAGVGRLAKAVADEGWLERECVAAVHLLTASLPSSERDTAERRSRGNADALPATVLLVEGWGDEGAFSRTVDLLLHSAIDRVSAGRQGLYRLQANLQQANDHLERSRSSR